MHNLDIKRLLGKGTIGEVYLTKFNNSREYNATKIIEKKIIKRPGVKNYFEIEIQMLKELKNPNIIKLIETSESENHYNITLEYCNGGSLRKCLKKYIKMYKKPFSEEIVQYIMKQIVKGVKCIHEHGIIHRDLKLDNILVKFYNMDDLKKIDMMKTHIKICDFGISIKAEMAFTVTGTAEYSDPFILKKMNERNDLKNSEGYDKSADIWSLGALCYEMLIGHKVFNGRNNDDLLGKVEVGDYKIPTDLSNEAASFLFDMLQYDPKKRKTIEQLAVHDFLEKKIQDFEKIRLKVLADKIHEGQLIINIKNNDTICDVLNDPSTISDDYASIPSIPYEIIEEKNKVRALNPIFNKFNIKEINSSQKNNNTNNNIKNKEINLRGNNNYNQSNNNNIQTSKENKVKKLDKNPVQKNYTLNNFHYEPKFNINLNNMQNHNNPNIQNYHQFNIKNMSNINYNIYKQNNNLINNNSNNQSKQIYNNTNIINNNNNQSYLIFNNPNIINNNINKVYPNTIPQYNHIYSNSNQNSYISHQLIRINNVIPNNNNY